MQASKSVWMTNGVIMPAAPALAADASCEVCVIGAGIAGLSTAYLLAQAGKSVIVLDAGPIGAGMSERTSAHLSNVIDDRFIEIEKLHGADGARLAAQSHGAAIDAIERIVRMENISCGFERVDGYLFAGRDAGVDLKEEMAAARRAGLDVQLTARLPVADFDSLACLRFSGQAQFHPVHYLTGLARAAQRLHVKFHAHTRVEQVEGGTPATVATRHGPTVRCNAVVVATNTPINDLVAIHTKQAAYLTYVIAARVPQDAVPAALYWDMEDPYHYVRVQPASGQQAHDLLLIGGEDHKTGQADDQEARFTRLEQWARDRFPLGQVAQRWSGQVMETVDGLAFIGPNPLDHANVFIATGDSGMGLTHGTIAGLLLSELIQGNEHPWEQLYDPARKSVRALPRFLRENANVMKQYGAWLSGGDVASPDEVPVGEGRLIRRGLSKFALYRDEHGTLHECSAVCPHLGCIVDWNQLEKTWDCPCHGSRFDGAGQVINGPATSDLRPVKREEDEEAPSARRSR